ncbi:MAG TPA: monovalent cation/H(+) antiporter subunit G [Bryobacteraceae bacterium]|nr:monovalent cation/H(+) antiporter subunit G [Bryobacteraceae bacterium]
MTIQMVAIWLLLGIGLLAFLFTAVGLLASNDVYVQIQFLSPGAVVGAVAICAAVLVKEGFSQGGMKAIAIAVLLLLANPVLSHATARAARIRRKGQWPPTAAEAIPMADDAQPSRSAGEHP